MTTAIFDPERKFVRVIERHASGLVEFEFAMGEPELCAEMVMPEAAFAAFCPSYANPPEEAPSFCGQKQLQNPAGFEIIEKDQIWHKTMQNTDRSRGNHPCRN